MSDNVTNAIERIKSRIAADITATDSATRSGDELFRRERIRALRDVLTIIRDEERNQILIDDDADYLKAQSAAMNHLVESVTARAYAMIREA